MVETDAGVIEIFDELFHKFIDQNSSQFELNISDSIRARLTASKQHAICTTVCKK